ncbi:hypothetical protein [Deinococcus misasensis]|uniref:hypothetical protein n=1 Tax=Deinococcus misasensis TaxID=392413 RepID=UPI00055132D8|nr:hypothetical protein [Deinococcus misasensis]
MSQLFAYPAGHINPKDLTWWETRLQDPTKYTPCFIRFGALPEGGKSRNHRSNTLEAGVSVYQAYRSINTGSYIIMLDGIDQISAAFCISDEVPAFFVTGDLLDVRGSDGEPLLVNCKAKRMTKKQQQAIRLDLGPSKQ